MFPPCDYFLTYLSASLSSFLPHSFIYVIACGNDLFFSKYPVCCANRVPRTCIFTSEIKDMLYAKIRECCICSMHQLRNLSIWYKWLHGITVKLSGHSFAISCIWLTIMQSHARCIWNILVGVHWNDRKYSVVPVLPLISIMIDQLIVSLRAVETKKLS